MRIKSFLFLMQLLAIGIISIAAYGQAYGQESKQEENVHETIVHVPVSVKDRYNNAYKAAIPVTIFRPDGAGPFPLIVINHGRGETPAIRATLKRARYASAGRYFVRKGFAVAIPTRLGNGNQPELGDPEYGGSCSDPAYAATTEAAVAQAEAVIAYMQRQAYIDPQKLVIAGQSVGGMIAVALTAKRPQGLIAAINFSGGHGGNPLTHPGEPCKPDQLSSLFAQYAKEQAGKAPIPTLWIYTENDRFFSPRYTQAWHAAYVSNGGVAEYDLLPPFKENGHLIFLQGDAIWQPIVDRFLSRQGFGKSGFSAAQRSNQYAQIVRLR